MQQGGVADIDLANLATNLAQLEMMRMQMEHDREMHDTYYSTIVALLTEIRDELRGDDGSD